MRAFLQSLDEKVQQVVEIGWTKPKEAPTDWDEAKIKAANFNSRVLNALFSAVTNEEFKKISSTETTKKAQTIIQTTFEGTKAVKNSKLQRLTTSFEKIKSKEDESFDEFYAKLKDIVNSAFNLGKQIPKPKIVRKVLRFLLERFHAKITAIKESKDNDKIPLMELVGNLQTYELGLTRIGKGSKSKSMALKAKSNETDESLDDKDSKIKSYITRQFKKFMKNANAKGFDKDHKQSSSSQFKSQCIKTSFCICWQTVIKTFSLDLGLLKVWFDVSLESSNCRKLLFNSCKVRSIENQTQSIENHELEIFCRILKSAQAHMTYRVKCFTPSIKGKTLATF